MKRILALVLIAGLITGIAYSQVRITPGSGGGGIIPPGGSESAGEALSGSASPKFMETHYWNGVALGASNGAIAGGFRLEESTANIISTVTATWGPGINITIGQGDDQRGRFREYGMKYGPLDLTHDEAQNYRFSIRNIAAIDPSMGTNGVISICIGDSSWKGVDTTPNGFGVIVCGSGEIFGDLIAQEWTAFVGDGTDTTYMSIGTVGDDNRFGIYAASDGGDVEFYFNGALAATISSPVRSNQEDFFGVNLWLQNDNITFWDQLLIGPLWCQREWD